MIVTRVKRKIDEKIGDAYLHHVRGDTFFGKCKCGKELQCSRRIYCLGKLGKWKIICRDCSNNKRFGDLTGQQFGRLKVINQEHTKISARSSVRMWNTKCECGNYEVIPGHYLQRKRRIQCSECTGGKKIGNITHKKTHIHHKKSYLLSACNNKNNYHYSKFGALGIIVCKDWYDLKKFKKYCRKVKLKKDQHIYLKKGRKVFCENNCFVRDMVKFTPYLDHTYLPDMNKSKFIKAISQPTQDTYIVDHPYKKVSLFSKLKAWLWGGKKVA